MRTKPTRGPVFVAWNSGGVLHEGVIAGNALVGARGQAAVLQVRLTKPREREREFATIPVGEVATAAEFYFQLHKPPVESLMLLAEFLKQHRVKQRAAARRGFLQSVGPKEEIPVQPRIVLAWSATKPNGEPMTDKPILYRQDDCFTLLVSELVFEHVQERAILSGLFEGIGPLSEILKSAVFEEEKDANS